MQKCCINGCDTNSRYNPDLSFFRFPKKESRNLLWTKNIGKKNIKPAAAMRICSLHFEENSINRTLNVVRLKDDAVPTLFPFTSPSLQPITASAKTINKIKIPQPMDILLDTNNPSDSKQLQPTCVVDSHDYEHNIKPEYLAGFVNKEGNTIVDKRKLQKINKMATVVQQQRKKIKILQQTCRRLNHKVHTLQNRIEELERQNVVDREGASLFEECSGSPEYLEVAPDF